MKKIKRNFTWKDTELEITEDGREYIRKLKKKAKKLKPKPRVMPCFCQRRC